MPIPPYDELTAPILQWLSVKEEASISEIRDAMIDTLKITEAEKNTLLPSGNQTVLANRVAWAVGDLYRAELVSRPERGVYKITGSGLMLAKTAPAIIDRKFLAIRYPTFKEFLSNSQKETNLEKGSKNGISVPSGETPGETLERSFRDIRASLKEELKTRILTMSPADFEYLCVDLLKSMGYGGSSHVVAQVTQLSRDGGIDGYISEDRLGLNMIYVQAKHYTKGNVGRPELQQFAGALDKHSEKGIFITSSDFSKDAVDYASKSARKIVLINGDKLADLMIEYNLGVNTSYAYEIKKIDSDYFDRE